MEANQNCLIYLITPPRLDMATFPDQLQLALDAGYVSCLQLRLKESSNDEIKRAAEILLPICEEYYIPLIINDHPELVSPTGVHGVHIGKNDGADISGYVSGLRKKLPQDSIIGVSCYDSKDRAMIAGDEGADYIAFSGFYTSPTKISEKVGTPVDIIKWWTTYTTIPCVAIGGIHAGNARPLIEAGVDFIAVISSVWQHPHGPASAILELHDIIQELNTT